MLFYNLCKKCKTWKFNNEFHSDRARKDGHYPNCKACHHIYMKIRQNTDKAITDRKIKHKERQENDLDYVLNNKIRSKGHYRSKVGRAKSLLRTAKRANISELIECTVTLEHMLEGLNRVFCAVTKIPFTFDEDREKLNGRTRSAFSPSIDRIVPSLGYTKENTRIVIWQMKGELTDSELFYICLKVIKNGSN